MDSKLLFADAATIATPLLVVFAIDTQSEQDSDARPVLLGASSALEEAARTLLASGEFKAALGEIAVLHAPVALKTERLMLVGLGKAKDGSADTLRKGAGAAVRAAKARAVRELAIIFPRPARPDDLKLSDALAARGKFAEAAHLLLLRSIEHIRAHKPDFVKPALTSREIETLGQLPGQPRTAFASLVQVVEHVLFAGHDIDGADFARCREAYERFAFPAYWSGALR